MVPVAHGKACWPGSPRSVRPRIPGCRGWREHAPSLLSNDSNRERANGTRRAWNSPPRGCRFSRSRQLRRQHGDRRNSPRRSASRADVKTSRSSTGWRSGIDPDGVLNRFFALARIDHDFVPSSGDTQLIDSKSSAATFTIITVPSSWIASTSTCWVCRGPHASRSPGRSGPGSWRTVPRCSSVGFLFGRWLPLRRLAGHLLEISDSPAGVGESLPSPFSLRSGMSLTRSRSFTLAALPSSERASPPRDRHRPGHCPG